MNEQNKWILPVEEDPETEELMITFPPELLEQAGWAPGDVITWQVNKDGSYTLTKKN